MSIKTRQLGDSEDDDSNDDDSDDVSNDDEDDVDSDADGENEASDCEKINSDEDENPSLNLKDDKEEEYVHTPKNYEFTDDEEVYDELYKDVNVRLKDAEHEEEGKRDAEMTDAGHDENSYKQVKDVAHVTLTTTHVTQKTKGRKQSSSVSSDFASQFLNLDNVPLADNEVVSMMNVKVRHEEPSTQTLSLLIVPVTVVPETSTAAAATVRPTIPSVTPLPQQSTPTPAPTTEATTSTPALPDFSSLFGFDQRVSALEKELSQFKQVDHSAQLLEIIQPQILAMVDDHLSTRHGYAVQMSLQSYTTKFEKKAQADKDRYINLILKSIKDIIKDEVKSQLPQILPKEVSDFATLVIQSTITESLENVVLAKSSSQLQSTYEVAASLTKFELKKILLNKLQKTYSLKRDREDKDKDEDPPTGLDQGLKKQKTSKDVEQSKSAQADESVFEAVDAEMPQNQGSDLGNTDDQTNVEAASKHVCLKSTQRDMQKSSGPALTDQLDWNNPKGHEYPFDLSKPLSLIEDRGCQVVRADYFFNNDLEYMKGGRSSSKYTTSTIKTKAAKYDDIQGIKDMVPAL
ncbi:hypothetical protein Tco_0863243 [Tanacetum coccineum]